MKDSGRSGVSSRVGRTHPSICRAQNVETEKPKVKRAHCDLSATYLWILTESHITPTTPPCQQFSATGDNRTSGRTWIGRCPIFDLVLAVPRVTEEDEKKYLISCNIIHKFSPQKICYHLLQIAAAGCGALEKSWHSMYAITP